MQNTAVNQKPAKFRVPEVELIDILDSGGGGNGSEAMEGLVLRQKETGV